MRCLDRACTWSHGTAVASVCQKHPCVCGFLVKKNGQLFCSVGHEDGRVGASFIGEGRYDGLGMNCAFTAFTDKDALTVGQGGVERGLTTMDGRVEVALLMVLWTRRAFVQSLLVQ